MLSTIALLVGCGSGSSEPSPSGSASASTPVFELREVLEVVTAGSPGFDALEVTCIDTQGGGSADCLDPVVAAGRKVVLLDPKDTAKYRLGPAPITGEDVASAEAIDLSEMGGSGWGVVVQLTAAGTRSFADLTTTAVGKQIAIVVDGIVVSAPTVQEPITSGAVQAVGFTQAEAEALAQALRDGV